ncbi:unnamed protein product [Toxocara canis]|uniref:Uncharacterized protein n=1 Tax=Toxocara canis TaxID=6265 RepID=A0A183VH52_TOXCA|nr:unnamed protein product [Toxocara canis]
MGSKENAQHCLAGSARTLKELEGQAAADSGKKTNSLDRGGSSPNMKEGTATKTRSSVLKDKVTMRITVVSHCRLIAATGQAPANRAQMFNNLRI